jgi:hypothetical protein
MHTAELLVPESSSFEVEIATGKLDRHEPHAVDQYAPELIQAGGNEIRSEIHNIINYIWNKEHLSEHRKESIIVPIDCSDYRWISLLPTTYKNVSSILISRLTPHVDEIIENYCDVIDQLLIRYSAFIRYWRKI